MDQQLGLEDTPSAYLARLVEVFREVKRVLRPEGVLWVNCGDSYASGQSHSHGGMAELGRKWRGGGHKATNVEKPPKEVPAGYRQGDLLGIPHRLAQALQADGWIWRADVCWVKAAAMPESVSGWAWQRCRVKVKEGVYNGRRDPRRGDIASSAHHPSLAQWSPCPGCAKCAKSGSYVLRKGSWRPTRAHESVFLFAKQSGYFCDGEAVRTRLEETTRLRDTYSRILDDPDEQFAVRHDHETVSNPAGANLRDWWVTVEPGSDVWQLKQESLDEAHYAAFPPSLPALAIRAGSSERGVCARCSMPWARVVETPKEYEDLKASRRGTKGYESRGLEAGNRFGSETPAVCRQTTTLDWRPTCSCADGEPVGALVLDPFVGSGTSGIVARRLGRRFLGIDLSENYCAMARRRIAQDQPLFNGAPPA